MITFDSTSKGGTGCLARGPGYDFVAQFCFAAIEIDLSIYASVSTVLGDCETLVGHPELLRPQEMRTVFPIPDLRERVSQARDSRYRLQGKPLKTLSTPERLWRTTEITGWSESRNCLSPPNVYPQNGYA